MLEQGKVYTLYIWSNDDRKGDKLVRRGVFNGKNGKNLYFSSLDNFCKFVLNEKRVEIVSL